MKNRLTNPFLFNENSLRDDCNNNVLELSQLPNTSGNMIANNDTILEELEGLNYETNSLFFDTDNYNNSSINDIEGEDDDDVDDDCDVNFNSNLDFNALHEHDNVYEQPAEYKSFDIVEYANKNLEMKLSKINSDNNIVLNDCPYKMSEVVEKFQYYIASENLYDKSVANLFGLLSDILPNFT
jgi:hypothetical protein